MLATVLGTPRCLQGSIVKGPLSLLVEHCKGPLSLFGGLLYNGPFSNQAAQKITMEIMRF